MRRLTLIKTLVLLFSAATIIFFMSCIPDYYRMLYTDCTLEPCSSLAPAPPTTLKDLSIYHLTPETYSLWFVIIECVFAFLFYTAGAIILIKGKNDKLGLLAVVALIAYGTTFTSLVYIGSGSHSILAEVIAGIGRMAIFLFLLLFPNGRLASRWTLAPFVLFAMIQILSISVPGTGFDLLNWSDTGRLLYYLAMICITIFSQVYRYRKISTPTERQQTKWVVYGVTVSFIGSIIISGFFVYPVFAANPLSYIYLSALLYAVVSIIPVTLSIAILRLRLWDIDPLVNRTILYGLLSLSIILLYSVLVLWLSNLFQSKGNFIISLISTGIVAVLFSPFKELLQRLLNRFMKGRHDDPYAVLKEMGDQFRKPLVPEESLQVAAESIRNALRLPYVSISIFVNEIEKMAAATGAQTYDMHTFPIVHGGEELGILAISSRSKNEVFTADDLRLIEVLLHQTGPILQTIKMAWGMQLLAKNLQESREKLILAREEERLQMRRNLHDGLAPRLLSLSFNVAAAEHYVKKTPEKALELLEDLRSSIRTTVSEIRTMVHDLRPPTLDEFGLIGAIQGRIEELKKAGEQLNISLVAPEKNLSLPAAVEVAAYRIVTECLVNVVKHANAQNCTVRILCEKDLQIEVIDDGIGIPEVRRPSANGGIGLRSIRERTEELGGQCFFEKIHSRGTRVRAILPI